jgi:hypothetical protein
MGTPILARRATVMLPIEAGELEGILESHKASTSCPAGVVVFRRDATCTARLEAIY